MKAIIPVAGLGTRMLPATKAIPKEMLPIVDKPLIQYVVNEAVAAGFKEIVLVTHSSKNSIENHFDTSFELEATLVKRVKRQLLDEIKNICPPDVTIMQVRQGEAKGLGHAVLCAYPLIGDEPCAILLPDMLIDQYHCNYQKDNLAAMHERFKNNQHSQIMVERVPLQKVNQYGIVDIADKHLNSAKTSEINGVIEKPNIEHAPSNLAIVGRYILSKNIWPLLKETPIGAGDEVQLTDAIEKLIKQEIVEAYAIVGKSHDCGSKPGYMKANIEYGLHHREVASTIKSFFNSKSNSLKKKAHEEII